MGRAHMTRSTKRSSGQPVIAIDGPAGAGKEYCRASTRSAARLRTGGHRRTLSRCGLGRFRAGCGLGRWLGPWGAHAAARAHVPVRQGRLGAPPVDGVDRSQDIRTPHISTGASRTSRHPEVRRALLDLQRRLGAAGGVVLEGRDIGTVVFPDADLKVFLTASDESRAARRHAELRQAGHEVDRNKYCRRSVSVIASTASATSHPCDPPTMPWCSTPVGSPWKACSTSLKPWSSSACRE